MDENFKSLVWVLPSPVVPLMGMAHVYRDENDIPCTNCIFGEKICKIKDRTIFVMINKDIKFSELQVACNKPCKKFKPRPDLLGQFSLSQPVPDGALSITREGGELSIKED